MLIMLILTVVIFVVLPYDAQMLVIDLLRPLWLSDGGRAILIGLVAGSVPMLVAYTLGWNALAAQIYHEDMSKADDAYRRRRR